MVMMMGVGDDDAIALNSIIQSCIHSIRRGNITPNKTIIILALSTV